MSAFIGGSPYWVDVSQAEGAPVDFDVVSLDFTISAATITTLITVPGGVDTAFTESAVTAGVKLTAPDLPAGRYPFYITHSTAGEIINGVLAVKPPGARGRRTTAGTRYVVKREANTFNVIAGAGGIDVATQAELDAHTALTTTAHGGIVASTDPRLTNARTPTGAAGGVLAGTYPNPSFAADMATQAELDVVSAGALDLGTLLAMAAGGYLATPDPSELAGATQLDIRVLERPTVYQNHVLMVQGASSVSNLSFFLAPGTGTPSVAFKASNDGVNGAATARDVRPPLNTVGAWRFTWRSSDGRVQAFTKPGARTYADIRSNSGWVQVGANGLGVTAALFNSTARLLYNAYENGSAGHIGGLIAFTVATTIDAAPAFDFRAEARRLPYTDIGGHLWTPQGTSVLAWADLNGNRIQPVDSALSPGLIQLGPLEWIGDGAPTIASLNNFPIGTRYIDRLATAGAVSWLKTAAGQAGWHVVYGDTGLRTVSSWDTAGVVTGQPLSASYAPPAGIAGSIQVQRVNRLIFLYILRLAKLNNTDTNVFASSYQLPVGYRPTAPIAQYVPVSASTFAGMQFGSNGLLSRQSSVFAGVTSGTLEQGTFVGPAAATWPTSLI